MPQLNSKIVLVEGNICAGKSTLSQALCNKLGLKLFLEPVRHNPFLELYYGNPKKYALVMQIWLLKQRYQTYVNAIKFVTCNPEVQGVVLDRSIYSDGTFAEQNFKDGNFTKEAYDYYKALVKQMMAKLPTPSLVLYLDVSAERCHERIMNMRQRECESGIPLPYLQGLDECHHEMLQRLQKASIKVLNLNWKDFGTDNSMDYIAKEINEAPSVQQHQALLGFISDDNRVAQRAQLHETDFEGSYLLDEQQEVESLMLEIVGTTEVEALTEGEVDDEAGENDNAKGQDSSSSSSSSDSDSNSSIEISTPELASPARSTKSQPTVSPPVAAAVHVEILIAGADGNPTTPRKGSNPNGKQCLGTEVASPVSVNDGGIFDLAVESN